jgi:hypothetical protein
VTDQSVTAQSVMARSAAVLRAAGLARVADCSASMAVDGVRVAHVGAVRTGLESCIAIPSPVDPGAASPLLRLRGLVALGFEAPQPYRFSRAAPRKFRFRSGFAHANGGLRSTRSAAQLSRCRPSGTGRMIQHCLRQGHDDELAASSAPRVTEVMQAGVGGSGPKTPASGPDETTGGLAVCFCMEVCLSFYAAADLAPKASCSSQCL